MLVLQENAMLGQAINEMTIEHCASLDKAKEVNYGYSSNF
jgi:hypothetical protein